MMRVDETGSGSCPLAVFGINDVDLSTSLADLCLTEVMWPICMRLAYLTAGSSCSMRGCCMKAREICRISNNLIESASTLHSNEKRLCSYTVSHVSRNVDIFDGMKRRGVSADWPPISWPSYRLNEARTRAPLWWWWCKLCNCADVGGAIGCAQKCNKLVTLNRDTHLRNVSPYGS